jgi:Na+/melibiose symporter-like transporter
VDISAGAGLFMEMRRIHHTKHKMTKRLPWFLFCVFCLVVFFVANSARLAGAQCAMCKANIAQAENAAEVSARVNRAVLVLLVPTFLLIGGIARLVFHYRNFQHTHDNIRSPRAQRGSQ